MKKTRNIIIGALLIVIVIMAVAYSAFATQLNINGTAEIVSEWNVKITSVTAEYVSENCNPGEPQFTNTSVTFNAELANPGDHITYLIIIENAGTFNATLDNITFTPEKNGSPAIIYTVSDLPTSLPAGEQAALLLKVAYDENTTEMPTVTSRTITGVIEYVQE